MSDVLTPPAGLRTVLRTASPGYLLLDGLARLPVAMLPLGILLLVADRTGSYAAGGLAVAALSVGGAVGGPLVGQLADVLGHRATAVLVTAVQVTALAAVLAWDAATPVTLLGVAVLGLANPQCGAMARSRWSVAARGREDAPSYVSGAMAFESALDEVSFVLGPVLVGTLAAVVSPTAALLVALVVAVVAQTGFGLHPSALPGRGRRRDGGHAPFPLLPLAVVLVATGSIGLVFGATQTGVAARMAAEGTDGLTGLVYGLMGVGSAVTALLTTRLPERIGHTTRVVAAGALLVVAGVLAVAATGPATLGAANVALGIAIAPALVSTYALAERVAPAGRGTATMTLVSTANVVGVAVGAAVAGSLVDWTGPRSALLLDCLAGVVLLLAGLAARRVFARR